MKKKILAAVLSGAMILSMTGCARTAGGNTATQDTATEDSAEAAEVKEEAAEVKEEAADSSEAEESTEASEEAAETADRTGILQGKNQRKLPGSYPEGSGNPAEKEQPGS